MRAIPFKIFLFVLAFAFVTPSAVVAQKYTTKGTKSKEVQKEKKPVCTDKNMRDIDSFDRRAVKTNAKIQALHFDFRSYATEKKSEEFIKELAKLNAFFTSEQYEEIKPIYKRCGVELPTAYEDKPFWMP